MAADTMWGVISIYEHKCTTQKKLPQKVLNNPDFKQISIWIIMYLSIGDISLVVYRVWCFFRQETLLHITSLNPGPGCFKTG